MTICDKINLYLASISPRKATNRQIKDELLIVSHEKVFKATQLLFRAGAISGSNTGALWQFWKPAELSSVKPGNS